MNQGFFSTEELKEFNHSYRKVDPSGNCLQCGLAQKCKNPQMPYSGEGKRNALIIGEAQGPDEDRLGTQFIGRIGQFLRLKLKINGASLDEDFYKVNAVRCFPNANGKILTPTPQQVALCHQRLEDTINELKPNSIWLFGGIPIQALYQNDFTHISPTLWRGLCIPDQKYKTWINPMFHPSYIQRKDNDLNLQSVFNHDIRRAIANLSREPVPDYTKHGNMEILTDYDDVIALLRWIGENIPLIAFDYETTGIKPQALNHKIVAISVAFGDEAYAFPFEYRSFWSDEQLKTIGNLWIDILESPGIGKIAHNICFEDTWSRVIFGVNIQNWVFDTCIAAHCIDNRRSFTDLYFQTYINFGILPWGKDMEQYLDAKGKEYNTVEEAPLQKLLEYNMYDSRHDFMLYEKQVVFMENNPFVRQGFDFFMRGILRMSDIMTNGICLDEDYYIQELDGVNFIKWDVERSLDSQLEAEVYKNSFGKKMKWNSPLEVGKLFYNIMNIPVAVNDEGEENYSTDKKALEDVEHPIARLLLEYRKYDKIGGTYLKPFIKGYVDGKIYPQYSLNIPISFRGSCSNPNWQNIPVRDEDAKRICRGGVIPSKGRVILSGDFKGIEVGTSACYHRDPNMIKYVCDPKTDMHRDGAMDIWMLPQEEIEDTIRFYAKNCWTFPQFYGDWYKSCAKSLWRNCINLKTNSGIILLNHLQDKGIKTYDEFVEHLQDVERIMWKERFKVYDQWKDDVQVIYRKQGYYDGLTGFRYQGYMSKKDLCNYPIQGTAFHLMLWSLMYICDHLRMVSTNIGQIHDDMLFDAVPEEVPEIMAMGDEALAAMKRKFPWICVPFSIKWSVTNINESWSTQHVVKV